MRKGTHQVKSQSFEEVARHGSSRKSKKDQSYVHKKGPSFTKNFGKSVKSGGGTGWRKKKGVEGRIVAVKDKEEGIVAQRQGGKRQAYQPDGKRR